ncbi:MAG: deoxyguanosinetriphosphate triphosphohydrolase [Thermincolia bacterium]
MFIREAVEEREIHQLSPYGAKSAYSKGRKVEEEPCPVRTAYQRDRDRIIHSKSFRRLKHKTQVFIAPEGDHYRTRLTHTLEVGQIGRTIARALRLNEDLTEAIALGHDLGHTPFGHAGEDALAEVYSPGFKHNEQSLRMVEVLARDGKGLNLTWEVRDGILNHTGPVKPATLEGQIVKIADRIAYINHDIDDALRGGIIQLTDMPQDCLETLGYTHSDRINIMITDISRTSWDKPDIIMSEEVWQATQRLRRWLFEKVYIGSEAKKEEAKAKRVIQMLYDYYSQNPEELPAELICRHDQCDVNRTVVDYIAGMTDRYALKVFQQLFLPVPWIP